MASTHAPGESVRPNARVSGDATSAEVARMAESCGGTLEVRAVILTADEYVKYEFEGFEGRFDGGYVTDARELRQPYGVLVNEGGQTFVVQMGHDLKGGETDFSKPKAGEVYRLGGDPERHVAWGQGLKTADDLARFATEDGGACGEFCIADRGDGSWALVSIPWSSGPSPEEREAAAQAVAASLEASPAPSR